MSDTYHGTCVRGRRFVVCDTLLDNFDRNDLVEVCSYCDKFSLVCCDHIGDDCHYYSVVYTDGATPRNGQEGAVSGLGIAVGSDQSDQYSIPVTDDIDPGGARTNQRAELLAAIEGIKRSDMDGYDCSEKACLVIATDSRYVVEGMAEWVPKWRVSTLKFLL